MLRVKALGRMYGRFLEICLVAAFCHRVKTQAMIVLTEIWCRIWSGP